MEIMHIDFTKYSDGLVPTVVQDYKSGKVLMLGFMNQEAIDKTRELGHVTFYSRSKQRLWTKGESSGNFLKFIDLIVDCDNDTLLIKANPIGATCHTGADTCFGEQNVVESSATPAQFLFKLEQIIAGRKENPSDTSYTSSLFKKGINKVAQKVGEEAIELVIEAKDNNRALFLGEAADLLFHYLVLLRAKDFELNDVVAVLQERHK
jgi:phosphoribosyl-ATP pyrophosphohydrolase/phosphoribosyl-AMP cyclohydrolase